LSAAIKSVQCLTSDKVVDRGSELKRRRGVETAGNRSGLVAFFWKMPQHRYEMKKIEAIIKPFRMDEVREALIEIGVEGVTVSEVKMLGRTVDHTAMSRGGEYFSDFLPKLKFEIVVADSRVRRTVQAIVGKARTGRINDGRVFVVPILEAIRIRTGERGESAV
jgi:nitrogen regulatory protein P-II 1